MKANDSARCTTCGQFYGDLGVCVTPGCAGDETPDTCSYCATPFEEDGIFWLTQPNDLTEANPMRIARCAACTGIHRQGTCGTCNTEAYHPTLDNTPWGDAGCRICQTADPFTHLLAFVAGVVTNHKQDHAAMEALNHVNAALGNDLADVRRINTLVHQQMARMHNPVTHARLAERMAASVSVEGRINPDMHIGDLIFESLTPLVRHVFLAGVAAVLKLKDEN